MTWINPYQKWLSDADSLKNAQKVVDYLYTDKKDWSKESICGLIGNMKHESSINPNMYEYGYSWGADRGFGLVQWTPRSKYWNWGSARGYSESQLRSGDAQLARIDYEVNNNIQWIPKASNFNGLTFKEFRTNSKNLTVEQLTEAFTWGYERPNQQAGEASMPARIAFAKRAFNELDWSKKGGGTDPGPDPEPDPDPKPDPSEPEFDFGKIKTYMDSFGKKMKADIEKMLSPILYEYGKSRTTGNQYVKLEKTYSNLYKITTTLDFKKAIDTLIQNGTDGLEDILGGIIKPTDPPPPPDPEPEPESQMYFPVDYSIPGVNFWKRSNWATGTLQKNMTYGNRSTGAFHAGYDVGSGGKEGLKIYAVRDGTVTHVENRSTAGFVIAIDHSTDKYHSLYMHLAQDSNVVNVGDKVKAGQHIATMGATGGNYAIHLHIEISPTGKFHNEGNTVDPEPYLKVTGDNKTDLPHP